MTCPWESPIGACEWPDRATLLDIARERDKLRSEVERLKNRLLTFEVERDRARAEVEKLLGLLDRAAVALVSQCRAYAVGRVVPSDDVLKLRIDIEEALRG